MLGSRPCLFGFVALVGNTASGVEGPAGMGMGSGWGSFPVCLSHHCLVLVLQCLSQTPNHSLGHIIGKAHQVARMHVWHMGIGSPVIN